MRSIPTHSFRFSAYLFESTRSSCATVLLRKLGSTKAGRKLIKGLIRESYRIDTRRSKVLLKSPVVENWTQCWWGKEVNMLAGCCGLARRRVFEFRSCGKCEWIPTVVVAFQEASEGQRDTTTGIDVVYPNLPRTISMSEFFDGHCRFPRIVIEETRATI